ncbi:MAG: hypothetical protein AB8B70_03155 [Prochlorococcus sp.]
MTTTELAPYLVALAFIEQEGKRSMPISGKSQSIIHSGNKAPDAASELTLELLLRVWQRTDEAPLKRVAAVNSLLILELPMEKLPEELPRLKSSWLKNGDTDSFINAMRLIATRGWTVAVAKYEPICFTAW